jgi:transcriptional regulator with XRE-family HTH domain
MVADTTTTFGALLRRHRRAAGLTQEALAERAGLSVFGIQKLERGTTHPYRDTAARLASVLELSADDADRFWAAVEPVRRRGSVRSATPRSGPHHNLPIGVTSFVGREEELESIPSRLQSAHLLTLTGAGGSGKTRLAIEVARRLVEDYRDGVWLVELAQLADPTLVPHRVAAMLGVQEIASRPLAHALADSLRDSELLLVMDNCEHLLESCAALLDLLMRHCPMLQILATSREPIGIPGEVIYGVSPLASPSDLSESVVEIERSPAVRLFADRASDVQPSFVLAENNANAIAQICRRLDGIPLALELAAARLDALTPGELANR